MPQSRKDTKKLTEREEESIAKNIVDAAFTVYKSYRSIMSSLGSSNYKSFKIN